MQWTVKLDESTANIRWRAKVITSTVSHVAPAPGLYVLGHVSTLCGLEIAREFIYAGRTDNMRRRLSEHTQFKERNRPLEEYLRTSRREIYVWYTTDIPEPEISATEVLMIRTLKPKFNRIMYEANK
jgi:hypothetical protein